MIVVVSLIVLLRGFPCFHDFRMVHPVPTSPFIQLNDFCTCIIQQQTYKTSDPLGDVIRLRCNKGTKVHNPRRYIHTLSCVCMSPMDYIIRAC